MSDVRIDDIRQLLTEDDLDAAIPQILQLARGVGGRVADDAVLLAGRVRSWSRRKHAGTETAEQLRVDRVRLVAAALAFLTELERTRATVPARETRVDGDP